MQVNRIKVLTIETSPVDYITTNSPNYIIGRNIITISFQRFVDFGYLCITPSENTTNSHFCQGLKCYIIKVVNDL